MIWAGYIFPFQAALNVKCSTSRACISSPSLILLPLRCTSIKFPLHLGFEFSSLNVSSTTYSRCVWIHVAKYTRDRSPYPRLPTATRSHEQHRMSLSVQNGLLEQCSQLSVRSSSVMSAFLCTWLPRLYLQARELYLQAFCCVWTARAPLIFSTCPWSYSACLSIRFAFLASLV